EEDEQQSNATYLKHVRPPPTLTLTFIENFTSRWRHVAPLARLRVSSHLHGAPPLWCLLALRLWRAHATVLRGCESALHHRQATASWPRLPLPAILLCPWRSSICEISGRGA